MRYITEALRGQEVRITGTIDGRYIDVQLNLEEKKEDR
jgi:hypothetical protein